MCFCCLQTYQNTPPIAAAVTDPHQEQDQLRLSPGIHPVGQTLRKLERPKASALWSRDCGRALCEKNRSSLMRWS
ncbi:hypothetical protein INR49_009983, partial [Caranx melampygus]